MNIINEKYLIFVLSFVLIFFLFSCNIIDDFNKIAGTTDLLFEIELPEPGIYEIDGECEIIK